MRMFLLLTFLLQDTVFAFYIAECEDLPKLTYCQDFNNSRWRERAKCKDCSEGRKYHCCKDYDLTKNCKYGTEDCEVFVEDCAVEKFCKAGQEPLLSYIKNQQKLDRPEVYCDSCRDSNRYNSYANKSSAAFSECPFVKKNICTPESHKIECGKSNETSERFCRCDVRNGYHPYSHPDDHPQNGCSFTNYECRNDTSKCGPHQQLLLNYTCAAFCKKGFSRLEHSDDCVVNPTTPLSEKYKEKSFTKSIVTSSYSSTTSSAKQTNTLQEHGSTTVPQSGQSNTTGKISVGLSVSITVIACIAIACYYIKKKGCMNRCQSTDGGDVNRRNQSRSGKEDDPEAGQSEQYERKNLIPPTPRDTRVCFRLNDEEYRELVTEVLKKCYVEMVEKLDPDQIIDFFRGKDVFTDIDLDDIQETRKTSDKRRDLLGKLKKKGTTAYMLFKESLVKTIQYSFLEELEKQEDIVYESVLKEGQESSNSDSDIESTNLPSIPLT